MLRFSACSCGVRFLVRIDREWWMRLMFFRRHYYCPRCKTRQLLPRKAFVSAWLPRDAAHTQQGQPADAPTTRTGRGR
jgi:ribosomal protein L37AE/L43A